MEYVTGAVTATAGLAAVSKMARSNTSLPRTSAISSHAHPFYIYSQRQSSLALCFYHCYCPLLPPPPMRTAWRGRRRARTQVEGEANATDESRQRSLPPSAADLTTSMRSADGRSRLHSLGSRLFHHQSTVANQATANSTGRGQDDVEPRPRRPTFSMPFSRVRPPHFPAHTVPQDAPPRLPSFDSFSAQVGASTVLSDAVSSLAAPPDHVLLHPQPGTPPRQSSAAPAFCRDETQSQTEIPFERPIISIEHAPPALRLSMFDDSMFADTVSDDSVPTRPALLRRNSQPMLRNSSNVSCSTPNNGFLSAPGIPQHVLADRNLIHLDDGSSQLHPPTHSSGSSTIGATPTIRPNSPGARSHFSSSSTLEERRQRSSGRLSRLSSLLLQRVSMPSLSTSRSVQSLFASKQTSQSATRCTPQSSPVAAPPCQRPVYTVTTPENRGLCTSARRAFFTCTMLKLYSKLPGDLRANDLSRAPVKLLFPRSINKAIVLAKGQRTGGHQFGIVTPAVLLSNRRYDVQCALHRSLSRVQTHLSSYQERELAWFVPRFANESTIPQQLQRAVRQSRQNASVANSELSPPGVGRHLSGVRSTPRSHVWLSRYPSIATMSRPASPPVPPSSSEPHNARNFHMIAEGIRRWASRKPYVERCFVMNAASEKVGEGHRVHERSCKNDKVAEQLSFSAATKFLATRSASSSSVPPRPPRRARHFDQQPPVTCHTIPSSPRACSSTAYGTSVHSNHFAAPTITVTPAPETVALSARLDCVETRLDQAEERLRDAKALLNEAESTCFQSSVSSEVCNFEPARLGNPRGLSSVPLRSTRSQDERNTVTPSARASLAPAITRSRSLPGGTYHREALGKPIARPPRRHPVVIPPPRMSSAMLTHMDSMPSGSKVVIDNSHDRPPLPLRHPDRTISPDREWPQSISSYDVFAHAPAWPAESDRLDHSQAAQHQLIRDMTYTDHPYAFRDAPQCTASVLTRRPILPQRRR